MRRRSERSVHTGERAGSDTTTWRMADCPSSTQLAGEPDELRSGRAGGRGSPSAVRRAMPRPRRSWWVSVSTVVSTRLRVDRRRARGRSGAIGSVASRAMSMNCSDMRMLPSPSAMAWWSFWTIAARPSSRPSTTRNSHSGRVRSNGVPTNVAVRSSSCRIDPGLGSADRAEVVVEVEVGLVAPLGRRQPAERRDDALAEPGHLHRRRARAGLRRRSRSGAWSRSVTLAIDELRCGSFSRFHISASTSVIRRSLRISRGPAMPPGTARTAQADQRGIEVCLNSLSSVQPSSRSRMRSMRGDGPIGVALRDGPCSGRRRPGRRG